MQTDTNYAARRDGYPDLTGRLLWILAIGLGLVATAVLLGFWLRFREGRIAVGFGALLELEGIALWFAVYPKGARDTLIGLAADLSFALAALLALPSVACGALGLALLSWYTKGKDRTNGE